MAAPKATRMGAARGMKRGAHLSRSPEPAEDAAAAAAADGGGASSAVGGDLGGGREKVSSKEGWTGLT